MSRPEDTAGPYIVWQNYGCEGWSPTSYKTLAEAICTPRSYDWILTMAADWGVEENGKVTISFKPPRPGPLGFPPHTQDVITGGCSACGASREAILDNLVPECVKK